MTLPSATCPPRAPARRRFDVHSGGIFALAMGELDGVLVAVSGGQDQTVRVWSLAAPELLD